MPPRPPFSAVHENYLRIFKLSQSVNGTESIPAQSTCHMASATEGEGGKKQARSLYVPCRHKSKWHAAKPLLQILKNTVSKTARRYAKLSAIREHQFGFANLVKRHTEKMREQSMQQALRILTEVNYY